MIVTSWRLSEMPIQNSVKRQHWHKPRLNWKRLSWLRLPLQSGANSRQQQQRPQQQPQQLRAERLISQPELQPQSRLQQVPEQGHQEPDQLLQQPAAQGLELGLLSRQLGRGLSPGQEQLAVRVDQQDQGQQQQVSVGAHTTATAS